MITYKIDGEIKTIARTGFPLNYRDVYVWVTAGHVIEGIEELAASSAEINAAWIDPEGRIPISIEDRASIKVNKRGIDVGFLSFRQNEISALIAGGIEFLDETVWENAEKATRRAEGFYIVGTPEQLVKDHSTHGGRSATIDYGIPAMPIAHIDHQPDCEPRAFWEQREAFYGQIVKFEMYRDLIDSIVAMSGGPVFAVRRTETSDIRYHLIGIQSAWLKESRIVRATPVEALDIMMAEIYERLDGQANS